MGRFRIETLAGAKVQLAKLDGLRLQLERRPRVVQRHVEHRIGGAVPWMVFGHRGRRDAQDTDRAWLADDRTGQWMRLLNLFLPLCGRREINEDAAVLDLGRIGRNLVLFVSRFPLAGLMMELPVMPGTDYVLAVERAFA